MRNGIPVSDLILLLTVVQRLKPTAVVVPGAAELEGSIVIDYGQGAMDSLNFSFQDAEIAANLNLEVGWYLGYAEVRERK